LDAADFLKERVGVFKDFSAERIRELLNGSVLRSFEANEAIAHQGAEATHFGVVLSGTVTASAMTDGTREPLGQLKAGDTFAEAALMTGNPLLADFIAESHCEVLLIPVSFFQSIIAGPRNTDDHRREVRERKSAQLRMRLEPRHSDCQANSITTGNVMLYQSL
jgi:CRP-like cAMP-binding protein